jgi:S1-C subfamily serine protease
MVTFDGAALISESAFARALSVREPGETVTVDVLRGGQSLTLRITLGESS